MTELVEYDAAWPGLFARAAAGLQALGGADWEIEHIGSTSIPGLVAKPIIDLAVRVGSFDELDARQQQFDAAGWLRLRRQPRSHRVRVRQDGRVRTHIAHFFTVEQWDSCHQRLFRDWLLAHPADCAAYRTAKLHAADRDGAEYTERKQPVVLEIVNRARDARGLAPIDDLDPEA